MLNIRKTYKGAQHHNMTIGDETIPIARRRSISVDKFVDDALNNFRASAIRRSIEMDYTMVFNAFAEYGILQMLKTSTDTIDPIFIQVFKKYMDYDELKESGLLDEWKDFQEFKEWKQKQACQQPLQTTKGIERKEKMLDGEKG